MTRFDVVVVLHDSAPELARLLASLERHARGAAHLIAVDTGSRDDGVRRARDHGATVVELPANPGFGAANNAGLEHARHEVTALLNPDVELLDDGLLHLTGLAAERDVLLFPRLLNEDGTIQDSVHPLPGTAAELLPALVHPRLLPEQARLRARPYEAAGPRSVGWGIAAAVVARTVLLRELGPFDPAAFLFYEDLELCLAAHERGVPCELRPEVRLRHTGRHSTTAAPDVRAQRRREVIGRRLGRGALRLDDLAQAITFARAAPVKRSSRARLAALRDARRSAG